METIILDHFPTMMLHHNDAHSGWKLSIDSVIWKPLQIRFKDSRFGEMKASPL
jgi:hypothetical protein